MADRVKIALVLSIWLVVLAFSKLARAQRWSRQVSNSEWIPLANPQNQQGQNQNLVPQVLPQIHQPLIPSSLPPELRQEYQQQLLQLQKTQESIQRLLALQQQLKAQQHLLQGQGFLPNGLPESEENKQALHQSALSAQGLPELAPDDVIPHQLSSQPKLPVYTSQNFHEQQGEAVEQEQYEDYNDRQIANYRNPERVREELREKGRYRPETSSGPGSEGESNNDGEEEVQVVYVPAETLAQRGQAKNQQRDRDRKQFGHQDTRHHQPRPYSHQHGSFEGGSHQRDNNPTTVSPEEDAYARDFLQQLQREHEGTDRLLKEAREKELARLREERKEIQRRAKLQQAALQREQEIQRQRDAEKKQKELDKLEEDAKQRELERIRESRERQRLEELERSKKAQARMNEEKRKQEEARQAEIDRLAALERQKKAEIERTIAAQKDLERLQKEEEERAREAERTHLARQKEASRNRHDDAGVSPQAQPLTRQHNNQQNLGQSGKYHRHGRIRNKQRQRQHNQNIDNSEQTVQETTTITPPSPNQPPLAVYMSKLVGDGRNIRITDVLKTLKGAQTIDVLDNVGQNAPDVFVGPSNLEVPGNYAKFDLPYLSSIDNNRVERRVDKLPFFVAPLSFNPPPGYSKIPFPAPHIGSVVINNLDSNTPVSQPDESLDEVRQSNLNPLIEPNSFSDESNKGLLYSTSYDSSTTPTHTTVRHEEPSSTSQYQPSSSYSNVETSGPHSNYRFRQSFNGESPSSLGSRGQSKLTYHEQSQLRPNFQEESSLHLDHDIASQYHEDSTRPTTPVYRRPNVVTAFAYQESSQLVPSSTPVYDQSYSNIRDDTPHASANAQLASGNFDPTQHREVGNRYQFTDQGKNERGQEYPREHVNPDAVRYEDSPTGPTQYNLPAELPPIHPQLPGLVNSLLEDGAQAGFVERHPNLPTTTVTSTTKSTTTETPLTTQRSRGRQRGRVVPTRPTTTTTTTLSPPGKSRETDRTRRPFARTRSRFTTTTEEYMEPYEPTKNKAAATTSRYNTQDTSRRPVSAKLTKSKNRETDGNIHSSRHQSHNVQAHEAANRNPSLDTNSPQPEAGEVDSNQQVYAQYDFASATTSRENYPIPDNHGGQVHSTTGEMEFTKTLTSPQTKAAAVTSLQNQGDPIAHHFQEHYPNSDSSQPGLEDTPVNGFNYQIRNEQATTPTIVPPTSRDYPYYQDKQEAFDSSQIPVVPTNAPFKSQINHYQRPGHYENPGLVRPQSQFPISDDQTSDFDVNHDSLYDPYSRDNEDALRSTDLLPEQAPLELTTEVPTTTTTTTEAAPVTFRQRVRARLGGRPRSDSPIQTKPRGSNNEYVRFSAVNNQNIQTTERPTTRHRESQRSKPKARQQHHGSQVQTEGNEYVRIQAPVRSYQKTIVTPPSTTQRTTTTQAPTTTTAEYESPNDELEYGFIRPPSFVPIHPVDNRYQNSYRLADNQPQVQSILPTDETASDTIPNHDQVSRNRPKYQSPNRRPANKVVSSTTLTSDTSPYTERSRTRVEEPKNNRIRPRGRKPGRRRTTTTTTTTTEYVLEENNDLPLEENYPRPPQHLDDLAQDRPEFFDEKFEAQSLTSEGLTNPGQQQERENSFSNQAFLLDFGSESDQLSNPELDQTQLASQPSRKYGRPGATGSRSQLRANQERDIYGSESQWSTKLTSTSFQPSASVNRLVDDDPLKASFTRSGKNKYSNDEARNEAPEVITAPPEEPYVTIMVSSDDLSEKPAIPSADSSLEVSPMTDINYGMKMGVDNRKPPIEKTTPAPVGRKTLVSNATNMAVNNEEEKSGDSEWPNQPPRRVSGRRRRVRVRVRPAVSDDFVTAESQHFNSAINNLFRDRVKYGGRHEESTETTTPVAASSFDRYVNTEKPEESIFEDLLKEVFKEDDKSSTISDVATSEKTEKVPTVSNQSEVSTDQPNVLTDAPQEVSNQPEVTSHPLEVSTQPEVASEEPAILTEQPEIVTGQSEIMANQSEVVTTAANQFDVVNTSENSTNIVAEQSPHPDDEYSSTVDYSNASESSTSTPLMSITMNPRKSPDSTDPFKAASGLSSENGIFDDNGITGQHNEVLENDYTEAATKNDINSLTQNNGEFNYPKNHRSEWSEVRYPTNPEFYNYHRQFNVTTTQLPGTETKSDGDASVKTLSDYVKAIFDTMKDADERKIEKDTFPTANSMSSDDQLVSTSTNDSSGTIENFETDPTTVPSSFGYSTESAEKSEDSSVKSPSNFSRMETEEKNQPESQKPVNMEDSNGDEEVTEELKNTDIEATTKYVDVTTEMSTDGNFVDSSSASGNLESSETPTIVESADPNESKIEQITTSTTESSPTTKGSHQMNLGAILRTSTTTKVSHMTEICYRGRCVMTKPKNEIYAR